MSSIKRAFIVTTCQRYIVLTLNFVMFAFVARLLTPSEIGLSVIGTGTVMVGQTLRDFGTVAYVVKLPVLRRDSIRTAFTITMMIAIGLAILLALIASSVASFYGEMELTTYFHIAAIQIVTGTFYGPIAALLQREMQFGKLAIIEIIITALGAVTTIVLASSGFGALSIAWAGLAGSTAASALAVYFQRDYWVFSPCLKDWRGVTHFGGFTSAGFVLSRSYDLFISTMCGSMLSLAALGKYNRATMICDLPLKGILAGVVPIALPALATEQRNGRCLKEGFFNAVAFLTAILWPALLFVMLFSGPIIQITLGSNWDSLRPLVPVIAAAGLMSFPSFLTYPMLVLSGDVTKTVVAQTISLPICAIIVTAAASIGLEALVWSLILTTAIQNAVALIYIRRSVGFEWRELLASLKPSVAVALASSAAPICIVALAGLHGQVTILDAIIGAVGASIGFIASLLYLHHPLSPHIRETLHSLVRIIKNRCQVA